MLNLLLQLKFAFLKFLVVLIATTYRGMGMKKIFMISLAAAALVLSACGGPKHLSEEHTKYDPTLSKAMNLALVAGLTKPEGPLKDSHPVQVGEDASSNSSSNALESATLTALIAAQSTGALLDAGMGVSGSMGMSALGLLMASRQVTVYNPVLTTTIFSWMPTNMAKDKEAAAMLMLNILHKEIISKLDALGAKLIESEVTPPNPFDYQHYGKLVYEVNQRKYITYLKVRDPYTIKSPSFVSKSKKSYYWSYQTNSDDRSPTMGFSTYRLNDDYQVNDEHYKHLSPDAVDNVLAIDLFHSVIKKLPSWTYTYMAPDLNQKQAPYFINNGEKLEFISPQ